MCRLVSSDSVNITDICWLYILYNFGCIIFLSNKLYFSSCITIFCQRFGFVDKLKLLMVVHSYIIVKIPTIDAHIKKLKLDGSTKMIGYLIVLAS